MLNNNNINIAKTKYYTVKMSKPGECGIYIARLARHGVKRLE